MATDADPARSWKLAACAVRAGAPLPESLDRCERQWTRAAASAIEPFEGSFSVRPPSGWNGVDPVELALFAEVGPSASAPSVSFRRRVSLSILRNRAGYVRVFLPVRCGQSSTDCTRTALAQCTVAAACDERAMTCGDEGQCVAPELEVIERPADAATDALAQRDASTRDSAGIDGSDGSDGSTAPTDTGVIVDAPATPVQLVWPVTEASVASTNVEFRWNAVIPSGAVVLCRDRACAGTVHSIPVSNSDRARSVGALPSGRLFWRVNPTGSSSFAPSVAWPITIVATGCVEPPAFDTDSDGLGDVMASAHQATVNGMTNVGTTRFWHGRAPAPTAMPSITGNASGMDSHYGESLAFADVDGNGWVDAITSEPGAFMGMGVLHVRLSTADRMMPMSRDYVLGGATGSRRGATIAALGDIDGDGWQEVAAADALAGSESVRVLTLRAMGTTARFTITGPNTGVGAAIASHCDLDGDGVQELVVGAPRFDSMGGAVRIYRGADAVFTGSSWTWPEAVTLRCAGANDLCGTSLSCGDINGDGRHDLAIGAPGTVFGSAFVLLSTSSTQIAFAAPMRLDGVQTLDRFGTSVALGRDADGDGYCDMVVGAQNALSMTASNAGTVSFYPGTPNGPNRGRAQVFSASMMGEQFGHAVALLRDTNGDGRADILVGADLAGAAVARVGRMSLYTVSATGQINMPAILSASGTTANDTFGGVLMR